MEIDGKLIETMRDHEGGKYCPCVHVLVKQPMGWNTARRDENNRIFSCWLYRLFIRSNETTKFLNNRPRNDAMKLRYDQPTQPNQPFILIPLSNFHPMGNISICSIIVHSLLCSSIDI